MLFINNFFITDHFHHTAQTSSSVNDASLKPSRVKGRVNRLTGTRCNHTALKLIFDKNNFKGKIAIQAPSGY